MLDVREDLPETHATLADFPLSEDAHTVERVSLASAFAQVQERSTLDDPGLRKLIVSQSSPQEHLLTRTSHVWVTVVREVAKQSDLASHAKSCHRQDLSVYQDRCIFGKARTRGSFHQFHR